MAEKATGLGLDMFAPMDVLFYRLVFVALLWWEEQLLDQDSAECTACYGSDHGNECLANEFEHIEETSYVAEEVPESVDCPVMLCDLGAPPHKEGVVKVWFFSCDTFL